MLPAAGQPIGPDDLIDISHESLIRRWQRFQAWLAEEDLDVAELKEWQQRARRRMDGGGWLDEHDVERAQRWRARVIERANPEALGSAVLQGPGRTHLSMTTSSPASTGPIKSRPSKKRGKSQERLARNAN